MSKYIYVYWQIKEKGRENLQSYGDTDSHSDDSFSFDTSSKYYVK